MGLSVCNFEQLSQLILCTVKLWLRVPWCRANSSRSIEVLLRFKDDSFPAYVYY
jgi:hypothetical protein